MSVYVVRTLQIIILLSYSLIAQRPLPYVGCILATLFPLPYQLLATAISLFSLLPGMLEPHWQDMVVGGIIITVHFVVLGIPFVNAGWRADVESHIGSKYLTFLYLLSFSMISLANSRTPHDISLGLLFMMLIGYSVSAVWVLRYMILVSSCVASAWGILIKLVPEA